MTGKLFSQSGIYIKWKKLFSLAKKRVSTGGTKFFFKNGFHILSIMVRNLAKNSEQKNTISPRQKGTLQLLFLLVETIIEIRKNQKRKRKRNVTSKKITRI